MKILLATDIHLTRDDTAVSDTTPETVLYQGLEHMKTYHADATALILTGDLSEDGSIESYARLKAALADMPFPAHVLAGNHDIFEHMQKVFPNLPPDVHGGCQYTFPLGPSLQGITLDTVSTGRTGGVLNAARLAWLDETLSNAKVPSILCMHHPPFATGLPAFDAEMLEQRDELQQIVQAHRSKIRYLMFGHCHMPINAEWHGIPAAGLRSMMLTSWPNFFTPQFVPAPVLSPAYSVMLVCDETIVTHLIEFTRAP